MKLDIVIYICPEILEYKSMMKKWGEKPYYSLDYALKKRYGGKLYKVALDAGFTCPNRDGTLGYGGCCFCSGGSGEFAGDRRLPISDQIDRGIAGLTKFHARGYIAYYQAYTNTYAGIDVLRRVYEPAFLHPQIQAVSIATRPDCLGDDIIDLLDGYQQRKPVWVELGLQTIHEATAERIRRGYPLSCFEDAVRRLRKRGLEVIVHVILGLPGEDTGDMLETISYLNRMDIQGIKLQLLHVIEKTDLAEWYRAGEFRVLTMEEYVRLVCLCIGHLSERIVIHRLTGDGPSSQLIAPLWSTKKLQVLNAIHHELKELGISQGCLEGDTYDFGTDNIV